MVRIMPGVTRYVYVDGVNKGEVYKKAGRWYWRRGLGAIAVEPFARGTVLADIAEWARKCCNGSKAKIKLEDKIDEETYRSARAARIGVGR